MDFEQYQKQAYVAIQSHENNKEEIMHWAIGLGEEAGEVLSVVKHKYYGNQYDVEELVGELGDVLWHVSALCAASGISMQDVAEYNIAKLQHRYPDGYFDNQRSIERYNLETDFKQSEARERVLERIKKKERN